MQVIRDQLLVSWLNLAALIKCIPVFNTAKLKELLLKLQIPAVEEVPGLTMSERLRSSGLGGKLNSYISCYTALLYNSITHSCNRAI